MENVFYQFHLAKHRTPLRRALDVSSDGREFEQPYLRPVLTGTVVVDLTPLTLLPSPVPVEAVQVQGRPDHSSLVKVHGRGPGVTCDKFTVMELKVPTAQSVVTLTFSHFAPLSLLAQDDITLRAVPQLGVPVLGHDGAPGPHHVPLELGQRGRGPHLYWVAILTLSAPIRGPGRWLTVLRLELRRHHS